MVFIAFSRDSWGWKPINTDYLGLKIGISHRGPTLGSGAHIPAYPPEYFSCFAGVDSLNLVANIVVKLTIFSNLGAKINLPRWWLNQPIWKKCSSNWIISPGIRDENKKCLKPPRYLSYLTPVNWLNISPLIQRVNVKEKIAQENPTGVRCFWVKLIVHIVNTKCYVGRNYLFKT